MIFDKAFIAEFKNTLPRVHATTLIVSYTGELLPGHMVGKPYDIRNLQGDEFESYTEYAKGILWCVTEHTIDISWSSQIPTWSHIFANDNDRTDDECIVYSLMSDGFYNVDHGCYTTDENGFGCYHGIWDAQVDVILKLIDSYRVGDTTNYRVGYTNLKDENLIWAQDVIRAE